MRGGEKGVCGEKGRGGRRRSDRQSCHDFFQAHVERLLQKKRGRGG